MGGNTALNQGVVVDVGEDENQPFNPDWTGEEPKGEDESKGDDEVKGDDEAKGDDAAAAAAEAERLAAEAAKASDNKAPPGFVPHGALHEERQRRKELEAEIAKMNDRFGQVLESVSKIGKPEVKKEETKIPDFEEDPVGNLRAQNEQLAHDLAELKAERQTRNEQNTQAAKVNEFAVSVAKQVNTFKKTTPDYDQAFTFVMERRIKDLMLTGKSEDEAAKILDLEAGFIAESAMQAGKNPGEVLYTMAKEWGYKPASKDDGKGKGKGEDDSMRTVERGMQRSTPGGGGNPSLRELASLDDDEFDQALKELGMK